MPAMGSSDTELQMLEKLLVEPGASEDDTFFKSASALFESSHDESRQQQCATGVGLQFDEDLRDDERFIMTRVPSPSRYWRKQKRLMSAWLIVSATTILLETFQFLLASSGDLYVSLVSVAAFGAAGTLGIFGPAVYFLARTSTPKTPATIVLVFGTVACFLSAGMAMMFVAVLFAHGIEYNMSERKSSLPFFILYMSGFALLAFAHSALFVLSVLCAGTARTVMKLQNPVSTGVITL